MVISFGTSNALDATKITSICVPLNKVKKRLPLEEDTYTEIKHFKHEIYWVIFQIFNSQGDYKQKKP